MSAKDALYVQTPPTDCAVDVLDMNFTVPELSQTERAAGGVTLATKLFQRIRYQLNEIVRLSEADPAIPLLYNSILSPHRPDLTREAARKFERNHFVSKHLRARAHRVWCMCLLLTRVAVNSEPLARGGGEGSRYLPFYRSVQALALALGLILNRIYRRNNPAKRFYDSGEPIGALQILLTGRHIRDTISGVGEAALRQPQEDMFSGWERNQTGAYPFTEIMRLVFAALDHCRYVSNHPEVSEEVIRASIEEARVIAMEELPFEGRQ